MNQYYTFPPWKKSSMIPTRISCSLPEFFNVSSILFQEALWICFMFSINMSKVVTKAKLQQRYSYVLITLRQSYEMSF